MRLLDEAVENSDFPPIIVNCRELVMSGITTTSEIKRAISTGDL